MVHTVCTILGSGPATLVARPVNSAGTAGVAVGMTNFILGNPDQRQALPVRLR